ncbi:SRPBCC family protein [Paenibacillus azoreducens]|uniref:SRPBCC family protein n=1 Tax=Paenibacillus azoreducens TaxID=116718 RepID=UPI0039F5EF71
MTIKQEIHIDASPHTVWNAWTNPDLITVWFAPAARVEPVVGGRFELYFDPADPKRMNTAGCRIIAMNAPNQFAFEWKGPDPFADVMNIPGQLTWVEIMLKPCAGDTTRLQMKHSGWGASSDWQEAKAWHVEAWKQVLGSLKSAVESGEGDRCCG